MINNNDYIRYSDVLSRKYKFYYKDIEGVMDEFINDVKKSGVKIKGPVFYSINDILSDEIVYGQLFAPIESDDIHIPEGMEFSSYFSIENVISICIYDNFEQNAKAGYENLMNYLKENNLEQVTPVFNIIGGDEYFTYLWLKIGVAQLRQ